VDILIALSGTCAVVLGTVMAFLLSNERRITKLETTSTFVQGRVKSLEDRVNSDL